MEDRGRDRNSLVEAEAAGGTLLRPNVNCGEGVAAVGGGLVAAANMGPCCHDKLRGNLEGGN